MAEPIVDELEPIKVETQHSEGTTRHRLPQHSVAKLMQGHAVGQIGQGVVPRHVGDTVFVAAALSHILEVATHPPPLIAL